MIIEGPHLGAPGERLQIIHTNIIMEKKKERRIACNSCQLQLLFSKSK